MALEGNRWHGAPGFGPECPKCPSLRLVAGSSNALLLRQAGSCGAAPSVSFLSGSCWTILSGHHTVIAHHSPLLGHPLGLDVQKLHLGRVGVRVLGDAFALLLWGWARPRALRALSSDCRLGRGVIHSATVLQLVRRIQPQLRCHVPVAEYLRAGCLRRMLKHTLSLGVGLSGDALATIGHVSKHGPRSIACVRV